MHAGGWSNFEFCCLSFPGPIYWLICLWLEVFCREFCKLGIFATRLTCTCFLACVCFPLTSSKWTSFFPPCFLSVFRGVQLFWLFSFNVLYCCKYLLMVRQVHMGGTPVCTSCSRHFIFPQHLCVLLIYGWTMCSDYILPKTGPGS